MIEFFAILAHLFHELFVRRALIFVLVTDEFVPVNYEVIAVAVEAFDTRTARSRSGWSRGLTRNSTVSASIVAAAELDDCI
jgi:hypothetical protein